MESSIGLRKQNQGWGRRKSTNGIETKVGPISERSGLRPEVAGKIPFMSEQVTDKYSRTMHTTGSYGLLGAYVGSSGALAFAV